MKNTETEHSKEFDVLPLLRERYSPRIFSSTPVTEKAIRTLFEAGRWAPSSNNLQPWRIIWGIKGSETYNRILGCLDTFNQLWAGNASALLLNAFKKNTPNGKENFHALHDLGLFMGNVNAQAQQLGIALHQMAGVQFKKAKEEFKFPEGYHVATAVALGYYGGTLDVLPENLKAMEDKNQRKRLSQHEFTFNGNFEP